MVEKLRIKSSRKIELIPITDQITDLLERNGCGQGVLRLFVPHTTAAVTINENADPEVRGDLERYFQEHLPPLDYFRHFEGNTPAHIWSTLVGVEKSIIVSGGRPLLGKWQGIYFCEFDGPRERTIYCHFQNEPESY